VQRLAAAALLDLLAADRHPGRGDEVEARTGSAQLRLPPQNRYFARNNRVLRARLWKALGDIKDDIAPERIVRPGVARLVD